MLQMTAEGPRSKKELCMKRMLWLSLFLILLPTVSAFSQDKPDPTAQAKPAATDQKPEAAV